MTKPATQGRRLIAALKRRAHTYREMLQACESCAPWKRIEESLLPHEQVVNGDSPPRSLRSEPRRPDGATSRRPAAALGARRCWRDYSAELDFDRFPLRGVVSESPACAAMRASSAAAGSSAGSWGTSWPSE